MYKKTVLVVIISVAVGLILGMGLSQNRVTTMTTPSSNAHKANVHWALKSKQVAYVLPNEGPYYDLKWYGVSSELKKLGYEPQKYSAGGYKNIKTQTDIIDNLIQKKVGAIILHAVDGKALAPFVEKAASAGIPVVAENVDINSPVLAGSVQLSNYQNGWELAMALVTAMGGKGKIAALIGPPGLDVTDDMWKAAKEYLKRFPKIKIVREDYLQVNAPDAQRIVDSILLSHPDITGIYAWYVQNAIGAALSVKNAHYKPGAIKIVAKDINPQGEDLLKEGYISYLLVGEPIEMGRTSAKMVDSIYKGLPYQHKVLMRNRLVDAKTVDLIDPSGFEIDK